MQKAAQKYRAGPHHDSGAPDAAVTPGGWPVLQARVLAVPSYGIRDPDARPCKAAVCCGRPSALATAAISWGVASLFHWLCTIAT